MRRSAVSDCLGLLAHFGIDPAVGEAIDVGGTETVYLDDSFQPNPLRAISPHLTLLDRGFNVETVGTKTDHELDFLDPAVADRLAASFDLTYSFDTLEHVSEPFLFCEHLVRITRPSGYIFIATVFSWPYHPSPEDYFRYSPTGLRECFLGPRNPHAGEVEVLWCGWDDDQRGVELLARRVEPGTPAVSQLEVAQVSETLGRPRVSRPLAARVRARLARALIGS
jgi:hypothetical protein